METRFRLTVDQAHFHRQVTGTRAEIELSDLGRRYLPTDPGYRQRMFDHVENEGEREQNWRVGYSVLSRADIVIPGETVISGSQTAIVISALQDYRDQHDDKGAPIFAAAVQEVLDKFTAFTSPERDGIRLTQQQRREED